MNNTLVADKALWTACSFAVITYTYSRGGGGGGGDGGYLRTVHKYHAFTKHL